jgi:hypothetical protein
MMVSFFRWLNHFNESTLQPGSPERQQFFLPMSEGGFGVPPMSDILRDAWIGSWSLAMTGVRHLLPQGVAPPKVEGAVERGGNLPSV